MAGVPLKSRKPIPRRTKPIRRGVRPKTRKADPSKRRFADRRDYAYQRLVVESYPCEVLGRLVQPGLIHKCSGWLEFAHVEGKGIGGYDVANGVSLCTEAHTAAPWSLHRDGPQSFAKRFGLDLEARARTIADELGYGENL